MDEQEPNEWIANLLGWQLIGVTWVRSDGTRKELSAIVPQYDSDPARFAEVKRKIERRGWEWISRYVPLADDEDGERHLFVIPGHGFVWSTSEELAGCLAFKAAIEATHDQD